MTKRLATLAFERGGLVGVATLLVYLWAAPRHVVDGDNAEFSALSELGGAAHPSGYPIYVLLLRVTSWFPIDSVAHRANLVTALIGVAAVLVLRAACRAWGARPVAASLAAALYAGGPLVLRTHTEAEAFALNALVVAAVLWLAAVEGPLRGRRRAFTLGLVAGLGLANHLTCVLIAPVGILGVVRGARESSPRALLAAAGGLALGRAPYLYLLAAPDTPASWGAAHSAGDVVGYFLRSDYGGAGACAPHGELDTGAHLAALAGSIGRGWLYAPALAGLVALGVRAAVAKDTGEPRAGWAMLAVSLVIAGPVLALKFNLPAEGLGLLMVERFHLLPILLLAPAVSIALDRVPLRPRLGEPVAVIVLAAAVALSLPSYQRYTTPAVETGVRNLLGSLPANAVVITRSDDLYFGTTYVQAVLGLRPDVVQVAWGLVTLPWYRERLARRGVVIDPAAPGAGVASVRVARQVMASGRPLFVDVQLDNVRQALRTYPHGTVFRVVPEGERSPTLDEVVALNQRLYAGFDLDYPRPGWDDGYPTGVHGRYAQTWAILSRALAAQGRADDAEAAAQIARQVGPR
ncbi:MAG: DUF2723 domain-containing protein [Myxococcales bacterium]|nr:DUF2723 domain-containing protein [Myxococcales bacterium]